MHPKTGELWIGLFGGGLARFSGGRFDHWDQLNSGLVNDVVYGVDIETEMVWYLNDRARHEQLSNLISLLAAHDDPHLPQPVDLVFLCNTYHHINDRVDYFTRLGDQLRPGGPEALPLEPGFVLQPGLNLEEVYKTIMVQRCAHLTGF